MTKVIALVPTLLTEPATAQAAMAMPLLTPAECSQISQVSPGVFNVKGSLRIAGTVFTDTQIPMGTVLPSGVDVGRYIVKSCFAEKPLK